MEAGLRFAPTAVSQVMRKSTSIAVPRSDITQLLAAWAEGDERALEGLLPVIYPELRRLAARYLRRERQDHTLQTTALVNEAFLRLFDQRQANWRNRAHFFALSATMMRRILVDYARRTRGAKRGGDRRKVSLEEVAELGRERPPDLVALDDALVGLAEVDADLVRLVELRFFGGLATREVAEVLHVSPATVDRRWRLARAWLYQYMNGAPEQGQARAD